MVIASSKYSKKSISDLFNGPGSSSSKLLRRHRELRQVGVAKENLCIYGVEDDVAGDEFVYPPVVTRFCGLAMALFEERWASVVRVDQVNVTVTLKHM